MSGREVWVIAERVVDWSSPTWRSAEVFHQPIDNGDADWVPVKCGGGIMLPGHQVKVPLTIVCQDCRAGRKTL